MQLSQHSFFSKTEALVLLTPVKSDFQSSFHRPDDIHPRGAQSPPTKIVTASLAISTTIAHSLSFLPFLFLPPPHSFTFVYAQSVNRPISPLANIPLHSGGAPFGTVKPNFPFVLFPIYSWEDLQLHNNIERNKIGVSPRIFVLDKSHVKQSLASSAKKGLCTD